MTPGRIGFVDVGASGGVSEKVRPYLAQIQCVLVEPDTEEAARLSSASNPEITTVIPSALGDVDGIINFFATQNRYCSSALPVNDEIMDRYGIKEHFKLKDRLSIKCSRYDTLFASGDLPLPHAIKIDCQGFEFQILEGFGKLLDCCMAIELETHFYKIYKDQHVIGDIIEFLSSFGFVLRRISNSRSPDLRGDIHFDGDLVEVDAFFTKNRGWVTEQPQDIREQFLLASRILDIDAYQGI